MPNSLTLSPTRYPAIDDNPNLQPSTKFKYHRELDNLKTAGISPLDTPALTRYASALPHSRRAFLKAALRKMSEGEMTRLKSEATPQNIGAVQAGVYRLEAMQAAIQTKQPDGASDNIWLSKSQVKEITALCGPGLKGQRDWIILSLLLGAGLRREELVNLTYDALKQKPMKSGRLRDTLSVKGKGDKNRIIPINPLLAERLRDWRIVTGGGKIARAVRIVKKQPKLMPSMSSVAVFNLVREYGALIGVPELAPHDLRRTYAHIGYDSGVPITQIKVLLGHASVATTQRYLNLELDMETTASDFIPLSK